MKFRYVFAVLITPALGPVERLLHEVDAENIWDARGLTYSKFRPGCEDGSFLEVQFLALAPCR